MSMPTRMQCRHILASGLRCGSPALKAENFCYYHHTTRRPIARPATTGTPRPPVHLRPAQPRRPHRRPTRPRRSPRPHRQPRHRYQTRRPPPLRPPDRPLLTPQTSAATSLRPHPRTSPTKSSKTNKTAPSPPSPSSSAPKKTNPSNRSSSNNGTATPKKN